MGILEKVPDFDEVFNSSRKTFEEVQAMLDEFLLGESPEESSSETTKYKKDNKNSASSVDQAFSELLGS